MQRDAHKAAMAAMVSSSTAGAIAYGVPRDMSPILSRAPSVGQSVALPATSSSTAMASSAGRCCPRPAAAPTSTSSTTSRVGRDPIRRIIAADIHRTES